MNHGNSNNYLFDTVLYKLNKKLSRLLGKTDKKFKPPSKSSNLMFSIIVLLSSIAIWLCTGFYYVNQDEFGLILVNGRVVKTVEGIRVGFTLPYPYGDIQVIAKPNSGIFYLGKESLNGSTNFSLLSSDMLPVRLDAKLSYKIINPKSLYLNHLQSQDNISDDVLYEVAGQIQGIIAKCSSKELTQINLTVLSTRVHQAVRDILATYGIVLTKFDIVAINFPKITQVESGSVNGNNNETTTSLVNTSTGEKYHLLDMNLPQLRELVKSTNSMSNNTITTSNIAVEHNIGREVRRYRIMDR